MFEECVYSHIKLEGRSNNLSCDRSFWLLLAVVPKFRGIVFRMNQHGVWDKPLLSRSVIDTKKEDRSVFKWRAIALIRIVPKQYWIIFYNLKKTTGFSPFGVSFVRFEIDSSNKCFASLSTMDSFGPVWKVSSKHLLHTVRVIRVLLLVAGVWNRGIVIIMIPRSAECLRMGTYITTPSDRFGDKFPGKSINLWLMFWEEKASISRSRSKAGTY